VTYGQRFRALRQQLWKGTVLALAERLGSKYPATIYNIEQQWRVPLLPTLTKHAAALGCRPWDLLIDVETEYDLVRQLAAVGQEDADRRWRALLRRYRETTTRTAPPDTMPSRQSETAPDAHTSPVSGASRPPERHPVAKRVAGMLLDEADAVAQPARAARSARQPTAAPRRPAAGGRPPDRKRRR